MTSFHSPLLSLLLAAVFGSLAATAVHAQHEPHASMQDGNVPSPRPWNTLDPAQRDVLGPLEGKWDTLSPRKQARMLKHAEEWVQLPPAQREQIRQRIARWQLMTPQQRRQTRANRHEFQQLPAPERKKLHDAFEHFQHLPPQQRDALIRQWRSLPPSQRLQWLNQSGHVAPAAASSTP